MVPAPKQQAPEPKPAAAIKKLAAEENVVPAFKQQAPKPKPAAATKKQAAEEKVEVPAFKQQAPEPKPAAATKKQAAEEKKVVPANKQQTPTVQPAPASKKPALEADVKKPDVGTTKLDSKKSSHRDRSSRRSKSSHRKKASSEEHSSISDAISNISLTGNSGAPTGATEKPCQSIVTIGLAGNSGAPPGATEKPCQLMVKRAAEQAGGLTGTPGATGVPCQVAVKQSLDIGSSGTEPMESENAPDPSAMTLAEAPMEQDDQAGEEMIGLISLPAALKESTDPYFELTLNQLTFNCLKKACERLGVSQKPVLAEYIRRDVNRAVEFLEMLETGKRSARRIIGNYQQHLVVDTLRVYLNQQGRLRTRPSDWEDLWGPTAALTGYFEWQKKTLLENVKRKEAKLERARQQLLKNSVLSATGEPCKGAPHPEGAGVSMHAERRRKQRAKKAAKAAAAAAPFCPEDGDFTSTLQYKSLVVGVNHQEQKDERTVVWVGSPDHPHSSPPPARRVTVREEDPSISGLEVVSEYVMVEVEGSPPFTLSTHRGSPDRRKPGDGHGRRGRSPPQDGSRRRDVSDRRRGKSKRRTSSRRRDESYHRGTSPRRESSRRRHESQARQSRPPDDRVKVSRAPPSPPSRWKERASQAATSRRQRDDSRSARAPVKSRLGKRDPSPHRSSSTNKKPAAKRKPVRSPSPADHCDELPASPQIGFTLGDGDSSSDEDDAQPSQAHPPSQWQGPPLITAANTPTWPDITPEMLQVVDLARQGRGQEEIDEDVETGFTKDALRKLRGSQWLSGSLVSFYGTLVVKRNESAGPALPRVQLLTTYRTARMAHGRYEVGPWGPENIFEHDLVLCPFNVGPKGPRMVGDHWILMVIEIKSRTIHCYDSMSGVPPEPTRRPTRECFDALLNFVHDQHLKHKLPVREFACQDHRDIPFQVGTNDCGVFVCVFMEHLSRGAPLLFTQENIRYWRDRISYELVTKKVMD